MAKPDYVAVFDCCGTLTPKSYVSLWSVVDHSGMLPPEIVKKMEERRQYYLSRTQDGRMTHAEERQWFRETVEAYAEAGLTRKKIREALFKVEIRKGVRECLRFLRTRNVPIAIVSYNLDSFVFAVMEKNKLSELVDAVYTANIIFGDGEVVKSYHEETAVFPDNKGMFSQRFANMFNVPFENILAIGDSGGDMTLGYSKENRLGVAKDEAEKAKIEKFFGEVVIADDFKPVQEWLTRKLGN